jgi:hypothetical protein
LQDLQTSVLTQRDKEVLLDLAEVQNLLIVERGHRATDLRVNTVALQVVTVIRAIRTGNSQIVYYKSG